jgi:hypothetical protein
MKDTNISTSLIDSKIYTIRGIKVMLDRHLAQLYQVETRTLNQTVKRNIDRFPTDFMFQLTKNEFDNLTSQIVISSWGGLRRLPYVFTEQGVYMLATVLKSKVAVDVNINIMRTFTKIKNESVPYLDIIKRVEKLEVENKDTKDLLKKVVTIVSTMQELNYEAKSTTKKIGFINE